MRFKLDENLPSSLVAEFSAADHDAMSVVEQDLSGATGSSVVDLRIPPSNRLEKLAGDRRGQHSIRVNDQWRICFRWKGGDAHGVEIVDYH